MEVGMGGWRGCPGGGGSPPRNASQSLPACLPAFPPASGFAYGKFVEDQD